jgi:hypothetical protein
MLVLGIIFEKEIILKTIIRMVRRIWNLRRPKLICFTKHEKYSKLEHKVHNINYTHPLLKIQKLLFHHKHQKLIDFHFFHETNSKILN